MDIFICDLRIADAGRSAGNAVNNPLLKRHHGSRNGVCSFGGSSEKQYVLTGGAELDESGVRNDQWNDHRDVSESKNHE